MTENYDAIRKSTVGLIVFAVTVSVISGCTPISSSPQASPLGPPVNQVSGPPVENGEEDNWEEYIDDTFGISFQYPSSWSIRELIYPEEDFRELEISSSLGYIAIEEWMQNEELTPRQWLAQNRQNYSELISVVAETEIHGKSMLLIGQAGTCRTSPLLVAIISSGNRVLLISHYELASRPSAPEFGQLLETLSFGSTPGRTSFPSVFFEFPQPPSDLHCP